MCKNCKELSTAVEQFLKEKASIKDLKIVLAKTKTSEQG